MIRRVLLTGVLAACTAAVVFGQQNATFVLTSGERVSGTLSYQGGNDFKLNGRSYPQNDVAIIAFVPGDPPAAELSRLAGRNASELERNMTVMRDGNVIYGKLHSFSPDGRTAIVNVTSNERREISTDSIARIYMDGQAARRVYNYQPGGATAAVGTAGIALGAPVAVNASQPWTDTGITVRRGDRLAFQTTGEIQVAPGVNAGPDGFAADVSTRRGYPVPAMPAGGLIARVGNSTPFPIGSNNQPITMPRDGRLYLGINDSNFGDNGGAFTVTITR